jgi:hypothetical protein
LGVCSQSWRPNWAIELVTGWLKRGVSPIGASARVAMAIFSLYWVVPGVLAGFEGTLFDPRDAQLLAARLSELWNFAPGLPPISAVAAGASPAQGLLYYTHDLTHFLFSICLVALGFLGNTLLDQIESLPADLARAGSQISTEAQCGIQATYARYRNLFRAPRWFSLSAPRVLIQSVAVLAGTIAFLFFIALMRRPCDIQQCWWGQSGRGLAGTSYSIAIGVVVYAAAEGLAAMLMGAAMVNSILRKGYPSPNLFAQDLANGMSPIGNFVLLSFVASLVGSVGIFIILRLHYFGVENLTVVWVLIIGASMFIPLATIVPMYSATELISQSKRSVLRDINATFDLEIKADKSNPERAEHIQLAIDLYQHVSGLNTFPFDQNKGFISALTLAFVAGQSILNVLQAIPSDVMAHLY